MIAILPGGSTRPTVQQHRRRLPQQLHLAHARRPHLMLQIRPMLQPGGIQCLVLHHVPQELNLGVLQ